MRYICFTKSAMIFPWNPFFDPLAKCLIFLKINRRLIQYHILLSLPFVYSENCFFVNCNCGLVLQKLYSRGGEIPNCRSSRPEVFCICSVPGPATLLKKRLWHSCFPVNFVKFLRIPFYIEHLWWLLL